MTSQVATGGAAGCAGGTGACARGGAAQKRTYCGSSLSTTLERAACTVTEPSGSPSRSPHIAAVADEFQQRQLTTPLTANQPIEQAMVDAAPSVSGAKNTLIVYNVLASGLLEGATALDLDKCCGVFGNSFYSPAEFPALRLDIRGSSSVYSMSLFESGRIQSTGSCRPIEAKRAMIKIANRLNRKFNYNVALNSFEVQNILAVFDFNTPLSLPRFVAAFKGCIGYEPERFPAARVRIRIPNDRENASSRNLQTATRNFSAPNNSNLLGTAGPGESTTSNKIRKLLLGNSARTNCVAGQRSLQNMKGTGQPSCLEDRSVAQETIGNAQLPSGQKEEWVTVNVFSTGKITFIGARSISSLRTALEELKPALRCGGSEGLATGGIARQGGSCGVDTAAVNSKEDDSQIVSCSFAKPSASYVAPIPRPKFAFHSP